MKQLSYVCICILLSSAQAEEWSRFRGPNGVGISDTTIPTQWTKSDYRWTFTLPGQGGSSPVLWKNRLFITSADLSAGLRFLFCLNVGKGTVVWKKTFPLAKYRKQKNNTFASNTPACDADHVYVLWQSPKSSPVIAFDHEGNKVWEIDLGPYKHGQGGAVSPMVYQDSVIIANDHKGGSFLLAVDRKTGKTQWKIPRKGERACYSTPCVYHPEGRETEIIFTHSFEGIIGVNAKSGKINWHIDPFGRFPQRAIGSPVIADDLIIGSSGFTTGKKNVVAVRINKTDAKLAAEEVYRLSRAVPHIPSPLVYKDRLYLWGDTGIVTCANVKTGKEIWKERVNGSYFGSPVCVNGDIYCIDKQGDVVIIATGDKFKLINKVPLGEASQATPAVSEDTMYLRTDSHLYALPAKK